MPVRLVDGKGKNSGRVEINATGSWKCICSEQLGVMEAKVVCRMLGFDEGYIEKFVQI